MSSSARHLQDQRGRTHGGVWLVVSWTLSARARLLLAFILLVSGVALRIAGEFQHTFKDGLVRLCLCSSSTPTRLHRKSWNPYRTWGQAWSDTRRAAADSPVQVDRRNAAAGAWAGTCHPCQGCSAYANYSKKRVGSRNRSIQRNRSAPGQTILAQEPSTMVGSR